MVGVNDIAVLKNANSQVGLFDDSAKQEHHGGRGLNGLNTGWSHRQMWRRYFRRSRISRDFRIGILNCWMGLMIENIRSNCFSQFKVVQRFFKVMPGLVNLDKLKMAIVQEIMGSSAQRQY